MDNRLFHLKDIEELYGLSKYEAQTVMNRVPKINVGRGKERPRWVAKQSDIEAYFQKKKQREDLSGLDHFGKLLRRR